MEHAKRQDGIEAGVGERQALCVSYQQVYTVGIAQFVCARSGTAQRRRRHVQAKHGRAKVGQMVKQRALTTSDVKYTLAGPVAAIHDLKSIRLRALNPGQEISVP